MQLLNTLVTVQFIATSITVICCIVVIDQSLLAHAAPSLNAKAASTLVGFLMPTPSVSNNAVLKWRAHPTELTRGQGDVAQEAEKDNIKATSVAVVASSGNSTSHGTSHHQEELDINQEATFQDQLQDDQEALHRIALILGLVGGLGGIAMVAGIVIYTKIRLRKKQEVADGSRQTSISGYSASYLSNERSDGSNVCGLQEEEEAEEEVEEEEEQDVENREIPLPSAPPAPSLPSTLLPFPHQHQDFEPSSCGNSIGFSQDAPGPSAPPEKEIDATSREPCTTPFLYHLQLDGPSCSSCPQCHNAEPLSPALLEVPPPAYTPSAPPLDALLPPGSPSSISHASSSSHMGNSEDMLLLSPSRSSSQRNHHD